MAKRTKEDEDGQLFELEPPPERADGANPATLKKSQPLDFSLHEDKHPEPSQALQSRNAMDNMQESCIEAKDEAQLTQNEEFEDLKDQLAPLSQNKSKDEKKLETEEDKENFEVVNDTPVPVLVEPGEETQKILGRNAAPQNDDAVEEAEQLSAEGAHEEDAQQVFEVKEEKKAPEPVKPQNEESVEAEIDIDADREEKRLEPTGVPHQEVEVAAEEEGKVEPEPKKEQKEVDPEPAEIQKEAEGEENKKMEPEPEPEPANVQNEMEGEVEEEFVGDSHQSAEKMPETETRKEPDQKEGTDNIKYTIFDTKYQSKTPAAAAPAEDAQNPGDPEPPAEENPDLEAVVSEPVALPADDDGDVNIGTRQPDPRAKVAANVPQEIITEEGEVPEEPIAGSQDNATVERLRHSKEEEEALNTPKMIDIINQLPKRYPGKEEQKPSGQNVDLNQVISAPEDEGNVVTELPVFTGEIAGDDECVIHQDDPLARTKKPGPAAAYAGRCDRGGRKRTRKPAKGSRPITSGPSNRRELVHEGMKVVRNGCKSGCRQREGSRDQRPRRNGRGKR